MAHRALAWYAPQPRIASRWHPLCRQHRTLRESEDEAFLQALAAHQGSKAALAAKLGISERSPTGV